MLGFIAFSIRFRSMPLISLLGIFICCSAAQSAVMDVFRYDLGEPGSFVGQLPQDSVGTGHATGSQGSITPGTVFDVAAPGSTVATHYDDVPNVAWSGQFNGSSGAIPTDNFAVEVWARPQQSQATNTFVAMNGVTNGSLKFDITNTGLWQVSYHNVDWVGAPNGTGQTVTPDVWTNLAVIRENGVSTLYIDGIAQAATTNVAPVFGNSLHIGVSPGGAPGFQGDLDQLRAFTFDPNTDDAVAALSINQVAVPEPASITLWCLLSVALCGYGLRFTRRK